MKISYILLSLMILFSLSSCEDYLDKTPDEDLTIEDVFTNPDWTRSYLSNIYSWLPNEANYADDGAFRSPFVGGSDEMEIAFGGAYSHMINAGAWNSDNITRIPIWAESYSAIRAANIFIAHVDNVPTTEKVIKQWKGEAYFLRAFFHFLVLRAYGPIPIADHAVNADDDWTSMVREPFDNCVQFISDDCDRAFDNLSSTQATTDYGRPIKASALALKSRLLLYAASPLYNGNKDLAELKDPETGVNLINQTYDNEKWKKAADAALAAITEAESSGYGLYHSADNDPVKNYEEVFTINWNKEILFGKNLGDYWHHMWCSDPISYGTPSIFNPTQELVDAYQMENGSTPITGYTNNGLTPIINSASGYVEDGYASVAKEGRWPEGVHNMYVNREPRFYASINFPGQIWKHSHELAFWYEGIDGKRNAGSDYCKTGYLMRKINNINISSNPWVVQKTTWNYFRVGELYLNYAEALNEYSGPVSDVHKYMKAIRERSGLNELSSNLDKDDMKSAIKHERQIELAFETHRFFDVRRWKDASKSEAKPIHSLNIWKGTGKQDDTFYERILCESRVFQSPKHYLFPIPQTEINKNTKKLVQNLGW